jgi:hypothetical protein
MKRIVAVLFALVTVGSAFGQQLGAPTPLQRILNDLPAIPIAGRSLKFQFGGTTWIATVNGENVLAGTVESVDINGGSILTLKQTHIWAAAAGRAVGGLLGPLGGAVGSLASTWVATPGPEIVLDYNSAGPRASFSLASEARIAEARASGVRTAEALAMGTLSAVAGAAGVPQAGIREAEALIAAANAAKEARAAETRLAEALVAAEARASEAREAERLAAVARSAPNPNESGIRLAEARAAEARAAEALATAEARMAEVRASEAQAAERRAAEASVVAAAMPAPAAPAPVQPIPPYTGTGADAAASGNKWVNLGGALGGGRYAYHNYRNQSIDGTAFAAGLLADFPVTNFLSFEAIVSLGYAGGTVSLVIPLMAKVGWKFTKIGLSADVGYTVNTGLTVGGTFGVDAGPGVVFAKFYAIPTPTTIDDSIMLGFFGYKIGVGNRR